MHPRVASQSPTIGLAADVQFPDGAPFPKVHFPIITGPSVDGSRMVLRLNETTAFPQWKLAGPSVVPAQCRDLVTLVDALIDSGTVFDGSEEIFNLG